MSARTPLVMSAIVLVLIGFAAGGLVSRMLWQGWVIESGCGFYDPASGEFRLLRRAHVSLMPATPTSALFVVPAQ